MENKATNRTIIIAEAGVNHNGRIELAKNLVDAAVDAGADFVKFQTFKAESIVTKSARTAEYQQKNSNAQNQYDMLKKLELSYDDHYVLMDYCRERGIQFFSTGFDLESLRFLKKLGLTMFKIPSGEVTNFPYLREIALFKPEKVILSTGMCNMSEIEEAVKCLESFGLPKQKMTVLHCNTEYPTPVNDVNLNAMLAIGKALNVPIGYSDHTAGITIPTAAVALGAVVIEKHFTLSRDLEGPDHKASLEPQELKVMIRAIRDVELAMGDGIKKASPSEAKNKAIARKSIVAAKSIKSGETFTEDNITTKRPGTGVSAMNWPQVIGKMAARDYEPDDLIDG